MFEYNKFKHATETNRVVIDNITTSENKRTILRRLQSNDRSYTKLQTSNYISDKDSPLELAWLDFFIGNNTKLEAIHLTVLPYVVELGWRYSVQGLTPIGQLRRSFLVINSSSRVRCCPS